MSGTYNNKFSLLKELCEVLLGPPSISISSLRDGFWYKVLFEKHHTSLCYPLGPAVNLHPSAFILHPSLYYRVAPASLQIPRYYGLRSSTALPVSKSVGTEQ